VQNSAKHRQTKFTKHISDTIHIIPKIPDVLGRRLSETKPAVEGECAPLLITKYEPDVIETDLDIEVGYRMDRKHVKNTF